MTDKQNKTNISMSGEYSKDQVIISEPKSAEEVLREDFKELNIYFNDLYDQGVNNVKDAGHLWIAFTDKFRDFEKKVLAMEAYRNQYDRLQKAIQWCEGRQLECEDKNLDEENITRYWAGAGMAYEQIISFLQSLTTTL